MVLAKAKEFKRRVDFNKNAQQYYKRACQGKYLDEACKHMLSKAESFKLGNTKWTKEVLFREALKYKSRREFEQKASGAYDAAHSFKIMDKICKHMVPKEKKWTYEKCKFEVKKYKNLQELAFHQEGCLKEIYKNKWMELINPLKKRNPYFIERKILHPKINKIIKDNKIKFLYEPQIVKSIIPDFVIYYKKNMIIIEAKSEYSTDHKCQVVDNQVKKQYLNFKEKFKEYNIIHILLSENGYILSDSSDYCLSLKQLNSFLKQLIKNKKFNYTKVQYKTVYKQLKKSALKIEKEYLKMLPTT